VSLRASPGSRVAGVVIFGPPGSGKGTQAELLVERLGWTHIAPGDVLRAERSAGTVLGNRAAQYLDRGELVPDALIMELIGERLTAAPAGQGFVLDGFPRTLAQAEALDALLGRLGFGPVRVVLLEVPEDRLRERLRERALTQGRHDDTPATITTRMAVYAAETLPALAHYEALGAVTRIEGTAPIGTVHESLMRALSEASVASPADRGTGR